MREAYFDNARVLLIFLVVFGHVIQPYTSDSAALNTLYMWIYTFHMPAFILIAGFFAKGSGTKRYIATLIKKLLIPYVIFQLIYTGYYFMIGKADWQASLVHPQWSLWFLLSLFSWHILLIVFKRWPAPLGLLISIQIGLIAGYIGDIGHTLSLSRTLVFFPFFLIGYWLTKHQLMQLKHIQVKVAALIVMTTVAIAIALAPEFNSGWLLASKSYATLGEPTFGGVARLLIYITSAIMVVSVLAWVPRRRFPITELGVRTLYVYVLHGFIIQFLRVTDISVAQFHGPMDVAIYVSFSALIVYILSSKPIRTLTKPLIEVQMYHFRKAIHSITKNESRSPT
ncbi:acyltransferase family protein [Lentibacillus saliphilus]|uniref:acyltransferase family protein n=1 Tax=Lentibacillus saliphilus TaxID=2737028 RepID=UPI001C311B90|nr:acyltransferase family protein [Lentibacillus saliphilus]